ncbi:MAG: discoidin domain-containing protein, partial [Oscillospiraceae bacterium]
SMAFTLFLGNVDWLGMRALTAGAAEAPVNLALGKTVVASGTEVDDGRWSPDRVVDGAVSKDSRWSSNKADDAWIYVDLGAAYEIDRVVLGWELRAKEFAIQISLDGLEWTTVHTQRDETSVTAKTDTVEFETKTARYVKMQGIERCPASNGKVYGYSMYEFEIYQAYDPQGNLAYKKPVAVSGTEVSDGRFGPELMVDGFVSASSRWSSNKADDAWCYVDLGAVHDVNRVVLNWQLRAIGYAVEVSTDGENWTEVYSTLVNSGAQSKIDDLSFDTVPARYVKMQGSERYPVGDTKYGYSLYEFEVYEDTHSSSLTEQQAAEEVLNGLQVPGVVYKDFTLQTKGVKYTTVSWESSDPAILSVAGGTVTVANPEERTTVGLTATVTCGEVTLTHTYPVVVRAANEIPVEYNVYP